MSSQTADKIVIVGAGEQGEIAWEYFTHDSPHEVVAFAVERDYLDGDSGYQATPVVALEDLTELYPADASGHHAARGVARGALPGLPPGKENKPFVALSPQKLTRPPPRLYRQV